MWPSILRLSDTVASAIISDGSGRGTHPLDVLSDCEPIEEFSALLSQSFTSRQRIYTGGEKMIRALPIQGSLICALFSKLWLFRFFMVMPNNFSHSMEKCELNELKLSYTGAGWFLTKLKPVVTKRSSLTQRILESLLLWRPLVLWKTDKVKLKWWKTLNDVVLNLKIIRRMISDTQKRRQKGILDCSWLPGRHEKSCWRWWGGQGEIFDYNRYKDCVCPCCWEISFCVKAAPPCWVWRVVFQHACHHSLNPTVSLEMRVCSMINKLRGGQVNIQSCSPHRTAVGLDHIFTVSRDTTQPGPEDVNENPSNTVSKNLKTY